jgi:hypothetical protein
MDMTIKKTAKSVGVPMVLNKVAADAGRNGTHVFPKKEKVPRRPTKAELESTITDMFFCTECDSAMFTRTKNRMTRPKMVRVLVYSEPIEPIHDVKGASENHDEIANMTIKKSGKT